MFKPKFTEDAFQPYQKTNFESFKMQKHNLLLLPDDVFAKVNYGDKHILGVSEDGNEETVKNFTLQDIQNYYDNYMTSRV